MNKNQLIIGFLSVCNVIHLCQTLVKFYLNDTHSINLLPPNIPLIEDKEYLLVDTTKIEGDKIQVLIINNTENELKFSGYQLSRIQPEYKSNSLNWFHFFYGWCGIAVPASLKHIYSD